MELKKAIEYLQELKQTLKTAFWSKEYVDFRVEAIDTVLKELDRLQIEPDHFADAGKMAEKIEELDIDSTTWNDLYIEQKLDILFEKQNEVIRRFNNVR